jgi:hypothetical protein
MDYILNDKDVPRERHENAVSDLEPVNTIPTTHDDDGLDPDLHVKTTLRHGDDLDDAMARKYSGK